MAGGIGMALVSVNATETGWDSSEPLAPALRALPHGAAVIVMIHGYRFSPWVAGEDPHRHILSFTPQKDCWKAVSWPRHLHLDRPGAGFGIGFGWHARGPVAAVARRAFGIGRTLAELIRDIKDLRPDLQVHILAHSLGARVALAALDALPPGALRRLIVMSGAEYRGRALAALAAPGARRAEVVNVTSGENALFDALFRLAVPAPALTDWPLSAGLPGLAGWTDLRVDCPRTLNALRALGYRTRPPATRICHWSTYLRPGVFRLYRDLCDPAGPDPLPRLAAALPRPASRPTTGGPAARLSPL
jgi:hypothetical protein